MASPTPGNFTGSRIGDLMTSGKKGEPLGKTALSYMYEIAAERNLLPKYIEDDYLFEIYQNQVSINNKFIDTKMKILPPNVNQTCHKMN